MSTAHSVGASVTSSSAFRCLGLISSRKAGPAAAGDPDRAQVHRAVVPQLAQPLERLGDRAQHGADQVAAGPRHGQHVPHQQALGELDAFLLGQQAGALGVHLGAGHQARDRGRGRGQRLLEPQ